MPTAEQEKTGLGNYFVANYPPFSFWKPAFLPQAREALNRPPKPGTPLGLYLHIPFCRKRCKFCYFRVYTDKNARDVETYVNALIKEVELYSRMPIIGGRPLHFVYFGGGTPSYLSAAQLRGLVERVKSAIPWEGAEEITFECEPGTLQQHKVSTLKELGITRLSLGIENFNDQILEANGRAHLSEEIHRAYGWIQEAGFDQVNIDLIAGMVGETWGNWRDCIRQTIEMSPDSVTIYQMELPFNTVFSKELKLVGQDEPSAAVADWPTKRAWVNYAFEGLAKAGYAVSSAYTVVKDPKRCRFVYRDSLWHGADMLGTGVASFGHVNGVHVQNVDAWDQYLTLLDKGEPPLGRALPVSPRHMMIRELILQLKTGGIELDYFRRKFGVDVSEDFSDRIDRLVGDGNLTMTNGRIEVTRQGLLQVDRFLPEFFDPEHRGTRYT
jgi:oxygen-independent coproporphyrinogen-3 oxidase